MRAEVRAVDSGFLWEMFLRGAVGGLLLFHLVNLARPAPHRDVRFAVAAFTLSVLAYLFCSMPQSDLLLAKWLYLSLLALCVTTEPLLWIAVRAVFADGFRFTALVIASPCVVALLGLAAYASSDMWSMAEGLRPALRAAHALAMVLFLAAALWEIGRGWRADLVDVRGLCLADEQRLPSGHERIPDISMLRAGLPSWVTCRTA